MQVHELPADFAAQRIKNLSFLNAVVNALLPKRNQKGITSLIEEFEYPRHGPGMMWERCRELVEARGCEVAMESRVVAIERGDDGAAAVVAERPDGTRERYPCDHVVSSMPLSALVRSFEPAPPAPVAAAAGDLRYRDFLTVALIMPEECSFPDNWIYVHSPDVGVGRLGTDPMPTSWSRASASSACSGSSTPTASRAATSSACRRPTRSTTSATRTTSRGSSSGSTTPRPTSIPSGATGCTATTTRTTRCTRRCSPPRTSPPAPTTTCGASTSRRSTTRRVRARTVTSRPARARAERAVTRR
ncbi:MAG: FAD-dependent oxidoreductase [Thermoleophilaceae bacterium]